MREKRIQEKTDNSESEPWYYRPPPQNNEARGKPLAGGSSKFVSSEFQESQQDSEATWDNCLQPPLPTIQSFLWSRISMGNIMMKA